MISTLPSLPDESSDPLADHQYYFSRELSWLEFNDRVLEEALDDRNALLERLKFIAIYGTNLDEFFMIRVAAIKQQIDAGVLKPSDDGLAPAEHLAAVSSRLRGSLQKQMRLLGGDLFPALAAKGLSVRRVDELDAQTRVEVERYFDERVFPVLTPL
ncbi:MAG: RNA degradosome polyphosphate kinase, partial [Vulcanimicrobiaceae bacterium]